MDANSLARSWQLLVCCALYRSNLGHAYKSPFADATCIATIVVPICSTFNAYSQSSWIMTTYIIGSGVSRPLSGHLTDIYGRRAGLIVCYVLFFTGTLLCGLSTYTTGPAMFFAGRTIQGFGGGPISSIMSYIESDLVPLRKRPLIEGISSVAYGATLALGGVYGGSINDSIGWRWAFLIQAPVIAFNAVLVLSVVRIPHEKSPAAGSRSKLRSIDYVGCILVPVTIIFFQYGINSGSHNSSWDAPLVIVSLAIAAASFLLLLYWDSVRAVVPLIPVRLFSDRTIACSQLSAFTNSAATASILFYVPIYLQVLGASSQSSGTRFIPYAIMFGLGSFCTGWAVQKLGRYYYVNWFIQLLCVAGMVCLCTMSASTPGFAPFVYLSLLGAGFGGAFVTRVVGLLSSVEKTKQAVIQAAAGTIISAGSTTGIVVATAIFQKLSVGPLAVVLTNRPDELSKVTISLTSVQTLPDEVRQQAVHVYLHALRGVFFFSLAASLVAAVSTFAMKNNPLSVKLAATGDQKCNSEESSTKST
jgi:MFS family permease